MCVIRYHKLVRDRIPEIIEKSGKTCVTRKLTEEEYLAMLDAKLDEELSEYHQAQSIEELADLLEVIRACAVARGWTVEELERLRRQKASERGGFAARLELVQVEDGKKG